MLITWRYRPRNTIIERLDPRVRIIFTLCMMFSIIQFWDLRFILFFFVLAIGQLLLARLTWQETRRFWITIAIITFVLSLMTALTGRGGTGVYTETIPHPLWQGEWSFFGMTFTPRLSVERFTFFVTQIVRFVSFAALAVPIPFTIHPARYGVTMRRLGIPDKFAFATDLAIRFIPSLGQDFQKTLDAQRARGYELEYIGGGLVRQVRNMVPLMIPLIIGTVVRSEEIVDAMDMRAFGSGPRSWLEELRFTYLDKVVLTLSITLFLGSTLLNLAGYGNFWIPPIFR